MGFVFQGAQHTLLHFDAVRKRLAESLIYLLSTALMWTHYSEIVQAMASHNTSSIAVLVAGLAHAHTCITLHDS